MNYPVEAVRKSYLEKKENAVDDFGDLDASELIDMGMPPEMVAELKGLDDDTDGC